MKVPHRHSLTTVVLGVLLFLAVAVAEEPRAMHIDLILDFVDIQDFHGSEQSHWNFLQKLCRIKPITRNYYGSYPPKLAEQLDIYNRDVPRRCCISYSACDALPGVMVRLSAHQRPYIPYEQHRYLLILTVNATNVGLEELIGNITETDQAQYRILGIFEIHRLPDIAAIYGRSALYQATVVEPTSDRLSAGWKFILVSFVLIASGVLFMFHWRSVVIGVGEKMSAISGLVQKEEEPESPEETAVREGYAEDEIVTNPHWALENLSDHRRALARQRATLPEDEVKKIQPNWTIDLLQDTLDAEPAFRLPPAKKPARSAMAAPDQPQAPTTTVLPPTKEGSKKKRGIDVPLGLAARRLANMMSTLMAPKKLARSIGMKRSAIAPPRRSTGFVSLAEGNVQAGATAPNAPQRPPTGLDVELEKL